MKRSQISATMVILLATLSLSGVAGTMAARLGAASQTTPAQAGSNPRSPSASVGTRITYQGQLNSAGAPARARLSTAYMTCASLSMIASLEATRSALRTS